MWHILSNLGFFASLIGEKLDLHEVFNCISLMREIEHLFICLRAICISFFLLNSSSYESCR